MIKTIRNTVRSWVSGYKVVEMTEIFKENGEKKETKGFFENSSLGKAIARTSLQADALFYKSAKAEVLTFRKTIGHVINQQNPVSLFKNENEAIAIRKKAIAALSSTERQLLHLD